MSISTTTIESVLVHPPLGCGTIDAPWRGWERQVESSAFGPPRTFRFRGGFWAADRAVRLGTGVTITAASPDEGRPWFLPADEIESLFRIDGAHDVAMIGVCLAGRGGAAAHGIVVRAGTASELRRCRFDDFSGRHGAAVLLSGESASRYVRGVVIEGSTFLHGTVAIRLERDVSDLLVTDNRFEEFTGPALAVDPRETFVDYGLIFVKNRVRTADPAREEPLLRVAEGAQNLRIAENLFEGVPSEEDPKDDAPAAIELSGGGPAVRRRVEVLLNTFTSLAGAAIEGRRCGPGLIASGNVVTGAGTARRAVIDLVACHGVIAEDNEIRSSRGAALRLAECRGARARGNEIHGTGLSKRAGAESAGLIVEGDAGRRIRVADNRIVGASGAGIFASGGLGLRIAGNEIRDCGEGLRVRAGQAVVVVGNDCRGNARGGIRIDSAVRRGLVALNHAIQNGSVDLAVQGRGVRCRANKVGREE
jgi:hypothetical protein